MTLQLKPQQQRNLKHFNTGAAKCSSVDATYSDTGLWVLKHVQFCPSGIGFAACASAMETWKACVDIMGSCDTSLFALCFHLVPLCHTITYP
jgi:hypothetical protein